MSHAFYIVDVFTDERYAGNQLAVVFPTSPLDAGQMQAIAREFNFSETTFVRPLDDASAEVRIFTPGMELPFAGHPTLGHCLGPRSTSRATRRSRVASRGRGRAGGLS